MNDCFGNQAGKCLALDKKNCDYPHCRFYKTEKTNYIQRVNAILRCREKGLCNNCRYTLKPCRIGK